MNATSGACPPPLLGGIEELAENRRQGHPLPDWIDATALPPQAAADWVQVVEFLYSYRGSPDTFNAYRRETERLLAWAWRVAGLGLAQIRRADIEGYIDFVKSPPREWLGTGQCPRFVQVQGRQRPNPQWRPFVVRPGPGPTPPPYQPSQKALQAVFAVLGSFFGYLVQEEYCDNNPVALVRQKSKHLRRRQGQEPIRRLSETQWAYVIETATRLADADPPRHERTLFMLSALYTLYLRISELVASPRWTPTMGDFVQDADGHWWFNTVGKGNKERSIAVSDTMLRALRRYRRALGLSPLPPPADPHPLILNQRGGGPLTSTRQVRMIVQSVFDTAIDRLRQDGLDDEAGALGAATVHWLRHTGISDDVRRRPREHVRDDAGHGSSAITDRYIDIERRARHESARRKALHPDD